MTKSTRAEKTAAARRARVEELRRQQKAKERQRILIAAGAVGIVVVVVAVILVIALTGGSGSPAASPGLNVADQIIPAAPSGSTLTQKPPKRVPNPTKIPGVLAFDTSGYPAPGTTNAGTLAHDHVTGPVDYAVTPPVGGPHNPIWMNAGVYTKPVPSERAVHDMEHGVVWITYRPNLPQAQVNQLVKFVARQSFIPEQEQTPGNANRYLDLTPWASNDLPAPIVMSSWGYQLRVNSPTDPRLQRFVDTFRHSKTYTPEYGSPVDGVPTQTGGEPAGYGSKIANPPGVYQ